MRVIVRKPEDLTQDERTSWRALRAANPDLASPYFALNFTDLVASVRSDVRVSVIEANGSQAGFLPFQRRIPGAGRPVAGRLNDFQGVIAGPGASISIASLVQACGLVSFDFDHWVETFPCAADSATMRAESPRIDLQGGFQGLARLLERRGSRVLRKIARASRALVRDIGPMRFELESRDLRVLDQVRTWKSEQYHRTNASDIFAVGWTGALLNRLLDSRSEECRGVLSTLYFGDRLVAAHMGMRSETVLHYWFPAYDVSFARHSPGLMLLVEICRAAAGSGVTAIDLGKGDEPYKQRLATSSISLLGGHVEVPSVRSRMQSFAHDVFGWVRNQRPPVPPAIKRRIHGWLRYR